MTDLSLLMLITGVIVGGLAGSITVYVSYKRKVADLEADVYDARVIREALKEEIFRLENQSKPKPRKRRGKAQKK